jgi:DNA polymerase I-like protein with 3'-5' exonuclease and polymerase domains
MANFSFGGIREQTTKKDARRERLDFILDTTIQDPDEPTFLVLTDYVCSRKLLLLKKDIDKVFTNYIIASAISTTNPFTGGKGEDGKIDTSFVISNESGWRKLLKQYNFTAVVVMGAALYSALRSADVWPGHFIDDVFTNPRCFLSSEFLEAGDLFYYPCFGIDETYPLEECGSDYVNYKTRFFWAQLKRTLKDRGVFDLHPHDYHIHVIETRDEANKALESMKDSELLAIDTETDGFDRLVCNLGCITLCNDGINGYFIPVELINYRLLSQVLLSVKRSTLVNAKFDIPILWRHGVSKKWLPTDDAMILAHCLDSDRFSGLKPNAIFDTTLGGYDLELDKAKKELRVDNYLQIPISILSKYATIDAIATWRIQQRLDERALRLDKLFPNEKVAQVREWMKLGKLPQEEINDWGQYDWYKYVMMPTYRDMIEIEYYGCFIDEETLYWARREFDRRINEKEQKLLKLWKPNRKVDFKSTKDLGLFIQEMGWSCHGVSKDGSYSTNDEALTAWKLENRPGIDDLRDFRSLQVGKNTFVGWRAGVDIPVTSFGDLDEQKRKNGCSGYEEHIRRHADGTLRMHQNFSAFGTETFRHKARDPNLQQVPAHGILADLVKPVFSVPTRFKYTIRDEDSGETYIGYGEEILIIQRDNIKYEACFSQVTPTDKVLDITGRSVNPDDIVIQIGSTGPWIKTYIKKLD